MHLIAVEVEPPERRGQGQAKQRGHDATGGQLDRPKPDPDCDHRFTQRDQQNQAMTLDEVTGTNPE